MSMETEDSNPDLEKETPLPPRREREMSVISILRRLISANGASFRGLEAQRTRAGCMMKLEKPRAGIFYLMVNENKKQSLRGAKRRNNPMRLLHFVRNDKWRMSAYL